METKPRYRHRRIGDLLPETRFIFWRHDSQPVSAVVGCRLGEHHVQVLFGHIEPLSKYFNVSVDLMVWVKVS